MTDEERRGMLAWYVSGGLAEAERAEVERSLAGSDPELRREIAEFRLLRAAVSEVGTEEPRFPPNLILDAWRQIQVHEREKASLAAARPAARLARFFDVHIASLWRGASGVGRLALAAQFGLVLAFGAALLRAPGEVEYEYGTRSGPEAPVPAPAPVPGPGPGSVAPPPDASGTGLVPQAPEPLRVKVMFATTASQQDVGALLRRLDAEIVAGPTALGLYTVAVQAPIDPEERPTALQALVRALEAEPALVRGVVPEKP